LHLEGSKECTQLMHCTAQDLNAVAARALAAALLPASLREDCSSQTVFGRGGRGVRLLGDLMEHLSSHPSYPILSLYTVPQARSTLHRL
jgi:hypothetical protein